MKYEEILKLNQSNAKNDVISLIGNAITEEDIYNIIYDLSESKYKNQSVEFLEYMENLISKAEFANMEQTELLKEAWYHYNKNEAKFSELF